VVLGSTTRADVQLSLGASLYDEALTLMPDAKLIAAAETGATIDTAAIVADVSYGAHQDGSFAVFDRFLDAYTHGGNCDSDDLPDDPWPAGVTLRFAVAASGEMFVGVMGDDDDAMSVMVAGGGGAYARSNDRGLIYSWMLEFDERANYLAWLLGDVYVNELIVRGTAASGPQDWDEYWTQARFDLFNGYGKSVFQVLTAIWHQQADYSWYDTSFTELHSMLREAWSPAVVLDANMTLERHASFAYQGVLASHAETMAYGDNQNDEELFLDQASTGRQFDCGSITRLFPGVIPEDVSIVVHSNWSSLHAHYRGAFVADSVYVTGHSEALNGAVNPAGNLDSNPPPLVHELTPGWQSTVGCACDFDVDGDVDGADFQVLTGELGQTSCGGTCWADADGDGDVDQDDLVILSRELGRVDCY
jgi:hypothetical protein